MSSGRRFRRRNHSGRLLAVLAAAALLLAALLMAFVGCGGPQEEAAIQEEKPEQAPSAETEAGGTTGGATTETTGAMEAGGTTGGTEGGGATVAATDNRPVPGQSFTAIAPPPGAEPLQEAPGPPLPMGAETQAGVAYDQYGYPVPPVTRTVPLGQTLVAGAQDLSDGPLKNNRLVAYYGTPLSGYMGVLGETDAQTMMANLKQQTAAYSAADPERPAVPTIELIASVAQRDPGPDGLYVTQAPPEIIAEYARLAAENGALLILDVQLGLATVADEIEILRPFLEMPHVHLAIDTEYSIQPGQIPGVNLGNVDGTEIAPAIQALHQMVEEKGLPDKLLLVHQFETGIVTNKQLIQPTENVEVVLNADGFGGPEAKLTKYDLLVRDEATQYGGFKLFYRQDAPVLTPEQVLQLDPAPAIVNYQ